MGILDRMGRVIASNFNALLDAADDPSKSLAQTLRDMQTELKRARTELVRAVAAERQLRRKSDDLQTEQERWERRAELAVENGDDALATEALLQRRRVATQREHTERLRVQQRANALDMKSTFEDMQRKFEDFNARQATIAAQVQHAKAGGGSEQLGGSGDAFAKFREIEDRIDGVDDVMDAQREVDQLLARDRSPMGLSEEQLEMKFRQLEGQTPTGASESTNVDAELSELKQKLRVRIK